MQATTVVVEANTTLAVANPTAVEEVTTASRAAVAVAAGRLPLYDDPT